MVNDNKSDDGGKPVKKKVKHAVKFLAYKSDEDKVVIGADGYNSPFNQFADAG